MSMLDDVLDNQPETQRPIPWRRILIVVALVGFVAGSVAAIVSVLTRPIISALPSPAQAAQAFTDPCGLIAVEEIRTMLGADFFDGVFAPSPDLSRCNYSGEMFGPVLLVDLQVSTDEQLAASGLGDNVVAALKAVATDDRATAPSVPIADLGDEAWLVDRNQVEVWARQGSVLVSVVVTVAEGAPDTADLTRLAALALERISDL